MSKYEPKFIGKGNDSFQLSTWPFKCDPYLTSNQSQLRLLCQVLFQWNPWNGLPLHLQGNPAVPSQRDPAPATVFSALRPPSPHASSHPLRFLQHQSLSPQAFAHPAFPLPGLACSQCPAPLAHWHWHRSLKVISGAFPGCPLSDPM